MNELEVALCTTQKRIGWEANFNWLWQFKLHYDEYSDDEYSDDEDGNDGEDDDSNDDVVMVMVPLILMIVECKF